MSHLSEEQLDQIVSEERSRSYPPLNDWRTIAAKASEEGLILGERSERSGTKPWMQAAAAVLLLIGGIAIGRTTIALPSASQSATNVAVVSPTSPSAISPTSTTPAASSGNASFASVDEASSALEQSLAEYQRATAYLARNNVGNANTVDSSRIYTARLAALNQVNSAMETALQTAPHDPVINQYYLATMGARVATQQMAARQVSLALKGF